MLSLFFSNIAPWLSSVWAPLWDRQGTDRGQGGERGEPLKMLLSEDGRLRQLRWSELGN